MKHVAILIETSRAYGRGLLRGIAKYHRELAAWSTYFQPQGLGDPPPPWLKSWRGDGIIARIDRPGMARAIRQAKVPVVNLRGTVANLPFPFLGSDNAAVAQLGYEHLRQRGFTELAFCAARRGVHPGLDRRREEFRKLAEHFRYHEIEVDDTLTWERQQRQLKRWLRTLPKPIGIMAANDDLGLQVLDACRRAGAAVPEDVAVLGVDNDEYLCGMAIPPLSSIEINSQETGFRAAQLLARLMGGKPAPRRLRMTPPGAVVVRESTDVLATNDSDVARAYRFIREHACRPIQVADVARHVSCSRSLLGPRFKAITGQTLHQCIQNVRVESALSLLNESDATIKQIAARCGFKTVQYMTRVFGQHVGDTPASYRTAQRSRK